MMEENPVKIVLIENDSREADLFQAGIFGETSFHLDRFTAFSDGFNFLKQNGADVIVIDLMFPDADWHEMMNQLRTHFFHIPVLALSDSNHESFAVEALQMGAQDYLFKGHADGRLIVRAIRSAIIRHHTLAELKALATIDELTDLYNRRGFINFGQQQLKIAKRAKKHLIFLFLDLDGLKNINDQLGHLHGDTALKETAEILKQSFRSSDVLARIGGDEFAVIAIEAGQYDLQILISRLRERLKSWNAKSRHAFKLSFSVGAACLEPESKLTLEEVMAQADEALYQEKKTKKETGAAAGFQKQRG